MGWLLLVLQILFWSPMAFRVLTRKTPETTFGDELATSFRSAGLVLYELGLALIWIGLGLAAYRGSLNQAVTPRGLIGALLHIVATALFAWGITAHRSWNMDARLEPDHQLCTVGPYRFVRHPIYLAFNLLAIGAVVWVPNVAVIVGALLLVVGGDVRARAEERILSNKFGEQYRAYMRRVNRAIPGIY